MAIRISRNEAGNCINFIGSTQPAYWNACLSAVVNAADSNRVDIINDIRSANEAETAYEFYAVDYTDFADRDGVVFTSAQAMVEYINSNANVAGVSAVGTDLTGESVDFRLDQTSTSVIMDNGAHYGVNTIKAVADTDGTIHLHAIGAGLPNGSDEPEDHKYFEGLDHTMVRINEQPVSGGINDVVNALNELFTVGAFESVVIADPYSTMVADVGGTVITGTIVGTHGIDPVGDDVFGTSASGNYNGYKSVETIDQAGEYFTFDIRNEGQIGFGLIHSDASYAAGHYTGTSSYADPSSFGVGNSAHFGFQFSHWFHPTPNGSWTNYGANTSYVMGPAWYSANTQFEARDEWLAGTPIKIRVGLDENGFIAIWSLADDGTTWKLHARTGYPVPDGAEFHLGVKVANSVPRLYSTPKVHLLEPAAPAMYFRYIESPDGVFQYPLFATEEEANYYDTQAGGSGTSHTHVFADEPTNTTWYMPTTNAEHNGSFAPVADLTLGTAANYTEITSLSNSDLTPPAFSSATLTVDELSAINYQTQPADTGYVTSITGLPAGLIATGGDINGTAPEVTGDNVTNPSDDYTVTVTRTNSYGSSTGTLTITVTNLTAPSVVAINGVVHEATSTALVDSDTLDSGSVIRLDNPLNDGSRLVIDKAFIDNYVLPAVTPGSGLKTVYIGFGKETSGSANWSDGVLLTDFELAFGFYSDDSARSANNWRLQVYKQGVAVANVGIGGQTSGLYNYVFVNDGGTIKIAGLLPSYGDASTFVWDGTAMSWDQEVTGLVTQNREIYIGTSNCQLDLPNPFSGVTEVVEPTAPTNLTDWSKALDFDGSSERAQQVDSSYYRVPMKMSGINNNVAAPTVAGNTSSDSNSRPWATAIVFKATTYNSNQHIWNVGEGSGTTDDNIYLRRDANRNLWFGWGRSGEINECFIGYIGGNIGGWWGVYVASTGERVGGGHTAAEIADCFDIRFTGTSNSWGLSANKSTAANWTTGSFGARMNREFTGDMTIGGRGANRSFRGKIASFVTTTLPRGVAMPSDAEISEMITDPKGWLTNYKVGNSYRLPWQSGAGGSFSLNDGSSAYSTQVWLMGDGTNDSYSNMIRNQVHPSDQNYTKLNMISMVSNDIQNVTITGLS